MQHLLLTGATRGLGRALAEGFAATGWAVSGCGTKADRVTEIATRLGSPHFFDVCDVTDESEVAAFVAEAIHRHGPPDLLVNNAALMNDPAPLWDVPANEFSRLIDVNVKAVHLVIRAALPAMIARGSGIVVNLSSGWGRSTSPEVAPYCASKFAIEGLTAALAQELPPGLAAVALNPGVIDTDMLRQCWADSASAYPDAATWSRSAVPFLQSLTTRHNGQPLTVPA